jgi:hypothetical protein
MHDTLFDDAGFAAGLLTDQQSTCCSLSPQRAIINIASAGSVLQNELAAGVQNSCGTPL